MDDGKWHLEHGDGRRWTQDELDRAIQWLRLGRYGSYRRTDALGFACVGQDGRPFLLDNSGEWWPVADYADMVVVRDGDDRDRAAVPPSDADDEPEMTFTEEMARIATDLATLPERLSADHEGFIRDALVGRPHRRA